ncbi:N-acetyltransferase, partial [Calderihabitans maritimus]
MSNFVHETARLGKNCRLGFNVVIMENVEIGDNVVIGHNVVIHAGTRVGAGTEIGDNAVLGRRPKLAPTSTVRLEGDSPPLVIGESCIIGTSAVLYAGTTLGNHVVVADMASVRENCRIGDYVVIGRGVAVENQVRIGSYTKIQTNAYITAGVVIEDHVFIAPMVTTTNDNYMGRTEKRLTEKKGAYIKRGARVGGNSILVPGVVVGEEAYVAAGAVVTKDVPPGKMVKG